MVKKFFMLTGLLSFSSAYSMMEKRVDFNGPSIEIQGPEKHMDTTLKETEAERLMRENSRPGSTNSHLSTYLENGPNSMPSTPRFRPLEDPSHFNDSGIAEETDPTTERLSAQTLEDISTAGRLSFSHPKPRLATPEPIQANDEEIARLTEAYKKARAALPKDLVENYLARDEYQRMVEAKQGAIEHLKQSSQIGDFPDQSAAIMARQEKLITYLKDKIASIASREKLELRNAIEKATDLEIKDIENNIATSKIKDPKTLKEIQTLLRHMKEERDFLSEKTLLSDENFETIMTVRAIRIQDNAKMINDLLSPNPKRFSLVQPRTIRTLP